MGLTFTVGRPADVFADPRFAEVARDVIEAECDEAVDFGPEGPTGPEPYRSGEVAWGGWNLLRDRAERTVGPERSGQLLSMEAWHGAYLPGWEEAGAIVFEGFDTPLDVASLEGLVEELEGLGPALGFSTSEAGLEEVLRRHRSDEIDDRDEADVARLFAELLKAARHAVARRQPLWVVK